MNALAIAVPLRKRIYTRHAVERSIFTGLHID